MITSFVKQKNFSHNLIALAGLCAIALLSYRTYFILSFVTPIHVVTSGFEEESLFAMWKFYHHQPVYTDPHQLPYSASYFNWLFYWVYGNITSISLNLFSLSEEWIPTIGRTLTLVVSLLGLGLQYFCVRKIYPQLANRLNFGLSALLWMGPLLGYWNLTVRPDVMGLFFEILAVWLFFTLPRVRLWTVLLISLSCFLAWSSKQTLVVTPGAIGLYFLCHKQWRALFTLSISYFALVLISLYLAPESMLKMLFIPSVNAQLSMSVLIENLTKFILKSAPIFILLLSLLWSSAHKRTKLSELSDGTKLSILALFVWMAILVPVSSKVGAAENYHFIALFYTILLSMSLLSETPKDKQTQPLLWFGVLYIAMMGAAFQKNYIAGIHSQKIVHAKLKQCISELPKPIFISNHYAALPWMGGSQPSFVLAYNYWTDRRIQANIDFQHDGIGGLVQQGYFNSLILPLESSHFDRGSLVGYTLQKSCAGYHIYQKNSASG